MDITRYIQELLYRHDCVILPGFGGLILHYSNGNFDGIKKELNPPGRSVTFNGLLTDDDGLLTSAITKGESISYEEGKKHVSQFMDNMKQEIRRTGQAKLENIGTFSASNENKWIFKPDPDSNFLESSFGLNVIYASPIVPEQIKRPLRTTRKPADRKPHVERATVPAPVKWTVLASIPIILFLLWGILFPASFQQKYTSYSGFLTDWFHQQTLQPANPLETMSHQDNSIPEITPVTADKPAEGDTEPVPESDHEAVAAVNPQEISDQQVPAPPKVMYHVIGGVFRQEENAYRYIEALSDLGYDAKMAGTNRKGFFRVSYDRFMTWSQALSFLNEIKENENPSAWILKY
jgi:hypothetical protein